MRPTKRNKRRGSREAELIPSKACFEATIQPVVKVTQRKSKKKRKKRRESRESEWIPSKACSEAIIQSEAIATQSEEIDETDEEKSRRGNRETEMHSDESLLRSRHSVESESDTEKERAEENDKEKWESCMMATLFTPLCFMPVCLAAVKMEMVAKAIPALTFSIWKVRGRSVELGLWVCQENFHGFYSHVSGAKD
jgi:hypothetical protein